MTDQERDKMIREQYGKLQSKLSSGTLRYWPWPYWGTLHSCPHCGCCPTCGRGGWHQPYVHWTYYPTTTNTVTDSTGGIKYFTNGIMDSAG